MDAVAAAADSSSGHRIQASGTALKRRQQELRAALRHQRRTERMLLATCIHHTHARNRKPEDVVPACTDPSDLADLRQEVVALRREVATLRASRASDLDIVELRDAVARLQIELGAAHDELRRHTPAAPRAPTSPATPPRTTPGAPSSSPLSQWYEDQPRKKHQQPREALDDAPCNSPSPQALASPCTPLRCAHKENHSSNIQRSRPGAPGGSTRHPLPANEAADFAKIDSSSHYDAEVDEALQLAEDTLREYSTVGRGRFHVHPSSSRSSTGTTTWTYPHSWNSSSWSSSRPWS